MTGIIEFRSRRIPRAPLPDPRLHLSEPAQMPRWWRDEALRLERLGYEQPHTAQSDYALARAVAMGQKITRYAVTTDISIGELTARWQKLAGPLRTEAGHLPLEAQEHLLKVLRFRAGLACGQGDHPDPPPAA